MSLYNEWENTVTQIVKTKGQAGFWQEYSIIEKKMYKILLGNFEKQFEGKVEELAEEFEVEPQYFEGFLDGINDSLIEGNDVENLERDSHVTLKVDFEKLYFNMLDAKADYLYQLPEWNAILTDKKKKQVHEKWKNSKTVIIDNKVGRNDPCPCGSGKKYKKCCGA